MFRYGIKTHTSNLLHPGHSAWTRVHADIAEFLVMEKIFLWQSHGNAIIMNDFNDRRSYDVQCGSTISVNTRADLSI